MSCSCAKIAAIFPAFSDVPAQSMVHPAGPEAAEIAFLWWVMLGAFSGVFILVMVLLLKAIFLRAAARPIASSAAQSTFAALPPWGRTGFIVAGGIILPILVLTPLYVYSLMVSSRLRTAGQALVDPSTPTAEGDALTVRVVGHMWWWEIRYPDSGIVSANEIYIPSGQASSLRTGQRRCHT